MDRPPRGTPEHKYYLVDRITDCAYDLDINILHLSRNKFLEWCGERELDLARKDVDIYGWGPIKNFAWDVAGETNEPTPSISELGERRSVHHANRHRRALERHLGDVQYIYEKLVSTLAYAVEKTPPVLRDLPPVEIPEDRGARKDALVVHVSDTHFGLNVDPNEVLGAKYNWTIAARRMGYFGYRVVEYAKRKGITKCYLILNGDIIEGKIHTDDNGQELLASQCDGSRQILTALVDYFRTQFTEIDVHCTTGNHGRWPFKGSGRATAQKYDSATTLIYRGMEQIFRDVEQVKFSIPRAPFVEFDAAGNRIFATHGDGVFTIGNPGRSMNMDKLVRQVLALEASEILAARPDVVLLGHYHFPFWGRIPNGPKNSHLMVNGCASGMTPYTNTIGLFSGTPVQTFFETSTNRVVDGFHQVDLSEGDAYEEYEQVVPVPAPLGTAIMPRSATTDFHAFAEAVESLRR